MASVTSDLSNEYTSSGRESRWADPEDWATSKALEGVDASHANPDGSQGTGRSHHGRAGERESLTLEFALPDINGNEGVIDLDDLMTRHLLNEIRNKCKVDMIHYPRHGYLSIQGPRIQNIHDACQAVRDLLRSTAKELVLRMMVIVHRSFHTAHEPILLQSIEALRGPHYGLGYRGVADSQNSLLDISEGDAGSLTAEAFAHHICQAAARISPVQGSLVMRVHLGSLITHKRQKCQGKVVDRYATTAEFETFLDLAASRGTVHVLHALGDASLNQKVRNRIYAAAKQLKEVKQLSGPEKQQRMIAASNMFKELEGLEKQRVYKYLPSNAWTHNVWELRPTYCLILFTANRRIEIDLREEASATGGRFEAAVPRIFANHSKSAAAEVVVTCPDKAFDWHVAIEANIAAHGTPEEYKRLIKSLRFSNTTLPTEYDFPVVAIPETALLAAKVENVACKVSWTFECRDSPYNVECSVYHEWMDDSLSKHLHRKRAPHQPPSIIHINTAKQTPRPRKACGISVYGQTWDSDMTELGPPKHDFVSNFVGTFFNNQLDGDLVKLSRSFLDEIEFLIDIISAEDARAQQGQSETEATVLL